MASQNPTNPTLREPERNKRICYDPWPHNTGKYKSACWICCPKSMCGTCGQYSRDCKKGTNKCRMYNDDDPNTWIQKWQFQSGERPRKLGSKRYDRPVTQEMRDAWAEIWEAIWNEKQSRGKLVTVTPETQLNKYTVEHSAHQPGVEKMRGSLSPQMATTSDMRPMTPQRPRLCPQPPLRRCPRCGVDREIPSFYPDGGHTSKCECTPCREYRNKKDRYDRATTGGWRPEDSVGEFLDRAAVRDPQLRTKLMEAYENFEAWCDKGVITWVPRHVFKKIVEVETGQSYDPHRGWRGITTKPPEA